MSKLVPLYGFLEGDTLGLLLLVHDDTRIGELADQLRASAAVRAGWDGDAHVRHGDLALDPDRTVTECGLHALDRVDVRRGSAG